MLTCTACFRRAIQSLAADLPPHTSQSLFAKASLSQHSGSTRQSLKRARGHRNHATLSSFQKGHHRRDLIKLNKGKLQVKGNKRRKAPGALSRPEIQDAQARRSNQAWMQRQDDDQHDAEDMEEGDHEGAEESDDLIPPSQLQEPSKFQERTASRLQAKLESEKRLQRRLAKKDANEIEIYYKDPLQLANGVLQRLRVPDIDGALRLVRASESFEINNTVSWNHCMDWLMSQGDTKEAIKVYNEMKKRGHKPDAHTYTIMLRGLSQHVHKPNSVTEAVKIYNSIFAPNSAVTPNTIHTNAVVNVCARGGDMDSMWAIAGRLPEKGAGSPDRLTYTLILNAIRENTIKEAAKTADKTKFGGDADAATASRHKVFEQAVADGRKLWEDVSYRWRRADLVIDEQLVCAMGRLLLGCGVGKDIEQVLDLVDSTMRLRIPERQKKSSKPSLFKAPTVEDQEQKFVGDGEGEMTSVLPLRESNVYATPGQNTLSMILEACSMHSPIRHYAPSYWNLLTTSNGTARVEPDSANIMSYLRVLRMTRSSNRVYELLSHQWPQNVAKKLYRRGTFVIAFATCSRDKNNPNVFDTAQKLLKLTQEKIEENDVGMFDAGTRHLNQMTPKEKKTHFRKQKAILAEADDEEKAEFERQQDGVQSLPVDPKILQYFVQLALDTTKGWNEGVRGRDDGEIFDRHMNSNHTLVALRTVAPHTAQLKRLLKAKLEEMQFSPVQRRKAYRDDPQVSEKVDEMMALMRMMIGAYDKVVEMAERFVRTGKEQLDERMVADFNSKKREYTAYMGRIQATMANQLRAAQAFADPVEDVDGSNENEDGEGENDDEDEIPDIEKRIKNVLDGVDAKILRERAEAKGYRAPRPVSQDPIPLQSRKQKNERTKLVEREMTRSFGKTDYGVLNNNLEIETGEQARLRLERQEREKAFPDLRAGRFRPQTESTNTTVGSGTGASQQPKTNYGRLSEVTEKGGADWLIKTQRNNLRRPAGASVLQHKEVQETWRQQKQTAAGSS